MMIICEYSIYASNTHEADAVSAHTPSGPKTAKGDSERREEMACSTSLPVFDSSRPGVAVSKEIRSSRTPESLQVAAGFRSKRAPSRIPKDAQKTPTHIASVVFCLQLHKHGDLARSSTLF